MYVSQNSWIENGPGLGAVRRMPAARPAARRVVVVPPTRPARISQHPAVYSDWLNAYAPSARTNSACVMGGNCQGVPLASGVGDWIDDLVAASEPAPGGGAAGGASVSDCVFGGSIVGGAVRCNTQSEGSAAGNPLAVKVGPLPASYPVSTSSSSAPAWLPVAAIAAGGLLLFGLLKGGRR